MNHHACPDRFRLHRIALGVAGVCAGLADAGPASAAASIGAPATGEIQVATQTLHDQRDALLAMNHDGSFVVVWRDANSDGTDNEVVARVFRADGTPRGGEILVNDQWTTGDQRPTHVVMAEDGEFLVVWKSFGEDGSGWGTYARQYAATGAPKAFAVRLNDFTTGDQLPVQAVMEEDGDTAVMWQSPGQDGSGAGAYLRFVLDDETITDELRVSQTTAGDQVGTHLGFDGYGNLVAAWRGSDGDGEGVYVRMFSDEGTAESAEILVNTETAFDQVPGQLAVEKADGDFVIAWHHLEMGAGSEVRARAFDSGGNPKAGDLAVNTFTTGAQVPTHLAVDDDGRFVVAWRDDTQDGSGYGIYARVYNDDATPRTAPLAVNTQTVGNQEPVQLAMSGFGDFVVAWLGNDGNSTGVRARPFTVDGTPRSAELAVNTWTTSAQTPKLLAMDLDGDFVVAWDSFLQDGGSFGVYARAYAADGTPRSGEIAVNQFTTSAQQVEALAADVDGDFVVTWRSFGQDNSSYGVFARRFAGVENVDLALAKVDVADPVPINNPLGYTLTVSNTHAFVGFPGYGVADGIRVTDTLPAGAGYSGFSGTDWTCSHLSGTVTCDYGVALPPATQASVTITTQAPGAAGTIQNTATVVGDQYDADAADDTDTESTSLQSAPQVVSMNRALANPSNAASVSWSVVFSEPVKGVNMADFTVTGGGTLASVVGSGTSRVVTVATNGTPGTLRLDLVDDNTILGFVSNIPLVGATGPDGSFTGQAYTMDYAAPTAIINQAPTQADPAGAAPFVFKLSFSEPPVGLAPGDIQIGGTAGASGVSISGSGTNYTVSVASAASSGTITASLPAGMVTDAAGNGNTASTSLDNSVTYAGGGVLTFRQNLFQSNETPALRKIRVDRIGGSSGAVSVQYAATAGTATAGADFTAVSGTLSWPDGDASERSFNLPVLGDTLNENKEYVALTLASATGGAAAGPAAQLEIADDDPLPVVSIGGVLLAGEGGEARFTVTLDAPSGREVTVLIDQSGTATRELDYTFRGNRVTLLPGVTSVSRDLRAARVDVIDDAVADNGETIVLEIDKAYNATVGTASHTITVLDED